MSREADRVDCLLVKWGCGVGNLGGARDKRRAVSEGIAVGIPGRITDRVMAAFFKEAGLIGVKKAALWVMGILEDPSELKGYLPEIERLVRGEERRGLKPEPGASMLIHPGETKTREEEYQRRRQMLWTEHARGAAIAHLSEHWGLPKWRISEEIDDYARDRAAEAPLPRHRMAPSTLLVGGPPAEGLRIVG